MENNKKWLIPVGFGLAIALGLILGNIMGKQSAVSEINKGSVFDALFSPSSKLETILQMVDADYIEEINTDSIEEDLIPRLLGFLDPHSVYISAKDMQLMGKDLEGSFSGIGVQFNIQHDTVMVVSVIPGGPSEKIGIRAGDRIVLVDGKPFVGDTITNEKTMRRLRGDKNTKVKLGIRRRSSEKILNFVVTRGDVPVKTVDILYMLSPKIGYVKVSSFGANTKDEFRAALEALQRTGAEDFVIDLRGNPGGYMEAAVALVNEFLPKGSLIVYAEGKAYPRKEEYASGKGASKKAGVAVLIDEWSASASEIFAGAIQDNDRGVIIGRRSFGKGLVQQQFPFEDGSAVRLTVARYFTPAGRSIQKPYTKGDSESYERDIMNRYLHGEFSSKDSIKYDSLVFYTLNKHRPVYGGGGITADIFIPRDTTSYTPYYNRVMNEGLVYDFAFHYADANRLELSKFTTWQDLSDYLRRQSVLNDFVHFAEKKGVKRNLSQILKSEKLLKESLFSLIARNAVGDEAFYPILNENDKFVQEAIRQLEKKDIAVK